MNINKAIEILTILEARSINNSKMFKKDALGLGLEALKRIKAIRPYSNTDKSYYLPGETK